MAVYVENYCCTEEEVCTHVYTWIVIKRLVAWQGFCKKYGQHVMTIEEA